MTKLKQHGKNAYDDINTFNQLITVLWPWWNIAFHNTIIWQLVNIKNLLLKDGAMRLVYSNYKTIFYKLCRRMN